MGFWIRSLALMMAFLVIREDGLHLRDEVVRIKLRFSYEGTMIFEQVAQFAFV